MIVEELFKAKVEESKKYSKGPNEVYVTDLVRCPLKAKFEGLYPELKEAENYSPAAILGDLVHRGLENFLKEKFNAEIEVEGSRTVEINGKSVTVKGRADAITQDYVIEIKTSRADKGLPHDHHVLQLRLYLWLFNRKKGILLYVTPDRVTEYEVSDPPDEAEVLRHLEDFLNIRYAPKFKWECNYCPFSVLCPNKVTS